jgi:flagellin
LASKLTQDTGMNVSSTAVGVFSFQPGSGTTGSSGGLTLQIGDTPEKFNKLTVNVGDMHAKALGIGGLDISTQDGATIAIDSLKTAINKVSSTRGDLGATQNRLEHTINNLAVMNENIQDAEATIRDTDVAEEMMAYTKNNILVQSAQAMLAQANQLPQGVLQLLG